MTFNDLEGLAAAIDAMDAPEERELMILAAKVQAATTIEAVESIVWK